MLGNPSPDELTGRTTIQVDNQVRLPQLVLVCEVIFKVVGQLT
ncbi:MAG TPA: hypothetical protein VHP11_02630 [Tepidisphaeraceae bacterium]|nr:hypothetical protein [Tepidisphaeraceae bacterium]